MPLHLPQPRGLRPNYGMLYRAYNALMATIATCAYCDSDGNGIDPIYDIALPLMEAIAPDLPHRLGQAEAVALIHLIRSDVQHQRFAAGETLNQEWSWATKMAGTGMLFHAADGVLRGAYTILDSCNELRNGPRR